jgi:hypothetical protein
MPVSPLRDPDQNALAAAGGSDPLAAAGSTAPMQPGGLRRALTSAAPGTMAAATGTADDVSSAFNQGRYGAAAGNLLRGTLATGAGVLDDTVGRGIRAVVPGLKDFGSALAGMDNSPSSSPSIPKTAPNTTPGAGAPTSSVPAAAATTQPGVAAPAAGVQPNTVLRNGNSFSGQNITDGFSYQDAGTGLRSGPVSTNVMPGLDPALAARMQQAQPGPAPAQAPAGAMSLGGGGGLSQQDVLNLAQHGHLTVGGLNAVLGSRGQDINAATQAGEQGIQARGQDVQRELGLRGQDVGLLEHQITAANQRALAKFEQFNKDRQFGLDVAKFGQERAQQLFNERESAQKNYNDWAEKQFTTTDKDGKQVPDRQKAADFTNVAQQTIGNLITRLQQRGDPSSLQKAQELQSKGLGALDSQDLATLRTLYDRRERFQQTRGVGPFSGSGPVSNDLFDYQINGTDNGLAQKRFTMAGGQSIGQNDLRYNEPANAILPDWFKTPTTALGPTLQEQQELGTKKGLR